MILFYSQNCQHCAILLDAIKKHDTKKTIKIVCIDTIINIINKKISNVPALMFLPNKDIIYGKAVFDYLLLPNRGHLFTNNSTRTTDKSIANQNSSLNTPIPINTQQQENEPNAFSLGSVLADKFSSIDDDNINSINLNKDKLYKWDLITNENSDNTLLDKNLKDKFESIKLNLPSIEELQKERENIFKDIK